MTRLLWTAGPDGTAHVRVGGSLRTCCGLVPVAEQLAHPERERCRVCLEGAEAADPTRCPHCRRPYGRRRVPALV